ncbi:MAG: hypothetical protein ACREP9_05470 [Candidatus Dormibacteraceae bacterium]
MAACLYTAMGLSFSPKPLYWLHSFSIGYQWTQMHVTNEKDIRAAWTNFSVKTHLEDALNPLKTAKLFRKNGQTFPESAISNVTVEIIGIPA